jgi:hypothetical protein
MPDLNIHDLLLRSHRHIQSGAETQFSSEEVAEVAVPRLLFREILNRIGRLRMDPEMPRPG